MRVSATIIATLVAAGLSAHAAAAEPTAAAGDAVATAPSRDDPQTQAQIDAFIRSPGPTVETVVVTANPHIDNSPWAQGLYTPVTPGIDAAKVAQSADVKPIRQMHGEVGGVIGTGGLRGGYAAVSLPVGDTVTVNVAVSDVQYGRRR